MFYKKLVRLCTYRSKILRYYSQNRIIYFAMNNQEFLKQQKLMQICVNNYSKDTENNLQGVLDIFNGITVDLSQETVDVDLFKRSLEYSLLKWFKEARRCIWFRVNIKNSVCVPILADKGFNFHHARDNFVMMYKWLPTDSEPNLPPSCHTNLGVGAMVFNVKEQILAISEKNYNYPHWKLPGGYVERGEDIIDAAVREVKEETGIETKFQSLVTFRHTHNMMFGNSDVYVLLSMNAVSDKISMSHRELKDCKWMDINEYLNHPDVHKWNRFVVLKALEYKNKRKLKLNIQKKIVKWATNVRDMNVLLIEDL